MVVTSLTMTACGDSTGLSATSTSMSVATSSLPSTTTAATTTTTSAVNAPTTATVRADGCRAQPLADKVTQEVVADVDGNGRTDRIRTHLHPSQYRLGESWLQVAFDDGRYSEPAVVETPDVLATIDLDRDGSLEIFVANEGNTARGGGVVRLQGCALRRVTDSAGQPFLYVYYGTGSGCAPACYPNVECQRGNAGIELVVSGAERATADPLVLTVPALTDDLVYNWRRERFRLQANTMISISREQGTARHGDLGVPKHQGFNYVAPSS